MKRKNVNLPPNLIYNDFAQFARHAHTQSLFVDSSFRITFYLFCCCWCYSSVRFWFETYRFSCFTAISNQLTLYGFSVFCLWVFRTAKYFVSLIEETLCSCLFFCCFLFVFLFLLFNKNCNHCSPKKKVKTSLYSTVFFVCVFGLETISCLSIQSI